MQAFLVIVGFVAYLILWAIFIVKNRKLKKELKISNEDLDKALEIGIDQSATYQVMLDRNMELARKNNSLVKALKNVRDELIKQRS